MFTILGKAVTLCGRLPSQKPHDPLVTWPILGKVTYLKYIFSPRHDLWPTKWIEWGNKESDSTHQIC